MKKYLKALLIAVLAFIGMVTFVIIIALLTDDRPSANKKAALAINIVETTSDTNKFNTQMSVLRVIHDSITDDTALYNNVSYYLDNENYYKEMAKARWNEARIKLAKSNIEKQVDPWDDSHIKLSEWVKSQLDYPDSYKTLRSNFDYTSEYIGVTMDFSCKNIYGMTVTHKVKAKCDIETGAVLEINAFE